MGFIRILSRMLSSRETEHPSPKVTYEFIHEFGRSDVSMGKVFAQFPNTSPSGKRVDSDNPIPRIKSQILVKNVTLEMSEWRRVPPKNHNGHIKVFLETTPLTPINRALAL
jgi:hypothetical protein